MVVNYEEPDPYASILADLPSDDEGTPFERLNSEFQKQHGRPLKVTGSETAEHVRLHGKGNAWDVRSRDLSPDELSFVLKRAPELGLNVRDYSSAKPHTTRTGIRITGPHVHLDVDRAKPGHNMPPKGASDPYAAIIASQDESKQDPYASVLSDLTSGAPQTSLPPISQQPGERLPDAASASRQPVRTPSLTLEGPPGEEERTPVGEPLELTDVRRPATDEKISVRERPKRITHDDLIKQRLDLNILAMRQATSPVEIPGHREAIDKYNQDVGDYNKTLKQTSGLRKPQKRPSTDQVKTSAFQTRIDSITKELDSFARNLQRLQTTGGYTDAQLEPIRTAIFERGKERSQLQEEIKKIKSGQVPKLKDLKAQLIEIDSRVEANLKKAASSTDEDEQRIYSDAAAKDDHRAQMLKRYIDAEESGHLAHPGLREAALAPLPEPGKELPWYLSGVTANIAHSALSLPLTIGKIELGLKRQLGIATPEDAAVVAQAQKDLDEIGHRGGEGLPAQVQRLVGTTLAHLPLYAAASAVGSLGGPAGEMAAFGYLGGTETAGEPEQPSLKEIGKSAAMNAALIPVYKASGLLPNRPIRMAAAAVGGGAIPAIAGRPTEEILQSAIITGILAAPGGSRSPFALNPERPPKYVKPVLEDMADYLVKEHGMSAEEAAGYVKKTWAQYVNQAEEAGVDPREIRRRAREYMEQYGQEPTAPAAEEKPPSLGLGPGEEPPLTPSAAPPETPKPQPPAPAPAGEAVTPIIKGEPTPSESGSESIRTKVAKIGADSAIKNQRVVVFKSRKQFPQYWTDLEAALQRQGYSIDYQTYQDTKSGTSTAEIRKLETKGEPTYAKEAQPKGEATSATHPEERRETRDVTEGRRERGVGDREQAKEAAPRKEEAVNKYASTQINLPEDHPVTSKLQRYTKAAIAKADLAEKGIEPRSHITVKYGLHGEDPEEIKTLLADEGPISVTLGKTSVFPASETGQPYDVVKIDIDSPDLHRLNKKIADALPHTDTFPEYKPHITLAYVKAGLGERYAGRTVVQGEKITLNSIAFSDKTGDLTEIPLTGKGERRVEAKGPPPGVPERRGKVVSEEPPRITGVEGVVKRAREGERRAQREADVDKQTGLQSKNQWARARPAIDRDPNTEVAVLDINNLKQVNDQIGHDAGDAYIEHVSQAVREVAKSTGVSERRIFRTGGDEIIVAAPKGKAGQVIRDVKARVAEFERGGIKGSIAGGVGETTKVADSAMYQDKTAMKGEKPSESVPVPRVAVSEPRRAVRPSDVVAPKAPATTEQARTRDVTAIAKRLGNIHPRAVERFYASFDNVRHADIEGAKATQIKALRELSELLDLSNKTLVVRNLRELFTEETGVMLPRTQKDQFQTLLGWLKEGTPIAQKEGPSRGKQPEVEAPPETEARKAPVKVEPKAEEVPQRVAEERPKPQPREKEKAAGLTLDDLKSIEQRMAQMTVGERADAFDQLEREIERQAKEGEKIAKYCYELVGGKFAMREMIE